MAALPQFKRDPGSIDVRCETWYLPLLQSTTDKIIAITSKKSFQRNNGEIMLVGVEGDVTYGARTKYEWLALIEDIDRGVQMGLIKTRPKSRRFSFPDDFEEEVADWASKAGKHRVAIICSCPSRLGDDLTIMEQVEEAASEFDNIECCWSRQGNLADLLFEPGTVAVGGGLHAADVVPAAQLAAAETEIDDLKRQLAEAQLVAAEPQAEVAADPALVEAAEARAAAAEAKVAALESEMTAQAAAVEGRLAEQRLAADAALAGQ
eukprot:SAG22_NODE_5670_length_974_cov_2.330286_1_plen_263_part_10